MILFYIIVYRMVNLSMISIHIFYAFDAIFDWPLIDSILIFYQVK